MRTTERVEGCVSVERTNRRVHVLYTLSAPSRTLTLPGVLNTVRGEFDGSCSPRWRLAAVGQWFGVLVGVTAPLYQLCTRY